MRKADYGFVYLPQQQEGESLTGIIIIIYYYYYYYFIKTKEGVEILTHFKIADGFLNRSKQFYAKGSTHISCR